MTTNNNTNNTGKVDVDKAGAILNSFTTAPATDTDELAKVDPDDLKSFVDENTDVTQADPVIIIDGVPVAREGDIVAVKGAEKVGKSQFAALIAAAVISPRAVGRQVWVPNGKTMIIFDTEQSTYSIKARLMRGIHTAAKEDATITGSRTPYGRVFYVSLYEGGPDKRLAKMKRVISAINPHIVYIDGIVQLMESFNDEKESAKAIDMLKELSLGDGSHKRVVVGVIHVNPTEGLSPDEKKMRGHIGTMLAQSGFSVISLSRKEDIGGHPIFTAKTSCMREEETTGVSFAIRKQSGGDFYEIQEDPEISAVRDIFTQVAETAERDKQPLTKPYIVQLLTASVKDPRTGDTAKKTKAYSLIGKAVALRFLEEHGGQFYFDAHR